MLKKNTLFRFTVSLIAVDSGMHPLVVHIFENCNIFTNHTKIFKNISRIADMIIVEVVS
jgi:hypothetical protein